jgi:hypothetical protein
MKRYLPALLLTTALVVASELPRSIELPDQFDQTRKLSFPSPRVTVLTIADRKGNDQIDGWIAALKPGFAGRVDFCGVANVSGVPGILQGHVRKKFQEARKYPVMMDWSGSTCSRFEAKNGVANILIFSPDGSLLGRFAGKTNATLVAEARTILDKALE